MANITGVCISLCSKAWYTILMCVHVNSPQLYLDLIGTTLSEPYTIGSAMHTHLLACLQLTTKRETACGAISEGSFVVGGQ